VGFARTSTYAQCANYPQLRQALQARQTLVAPMSQAELRVAVLYPAAAVGLDIEAGLVELLLRDSGTTPGNGDRADGTASEHDAVGPNQFRPGNLTAQDRNLVP
jgi:Novel STAND NTPase 1